MMRKSHAAASAAPPPMQYFSIAQIVTCSTFSHASHSSGPMRTMWRRSSNPFARRRSSAGILQIGAGRERALAREDHGLRFQIVAKLFAASVSSRISLPRQRIAPVAAIHRDGRDCAVADDGDEGADAVFAHAAFISFFADEWRCPRALRGSAALRAAEHLRVTHDIGDSSVILRCEERSSEPRRTARARNLTSVLDKSPGNDKRTCLIQ